MSPSNLLSSEEIYDLGESAVDAAEPLSIAAELVAVVDEARLADPADAARALIRAAEIHQEENDVDTALALAERAIEAHRSHGDPDDGYPRAYRAELLYELGRTDEAMALLTELRPLLAIDDQAAYYLTDILAENGHPELAEEWLTDALRTVLDRPEWTDDAEHAEHAGGSESDVGHTHDDPEEYDEQGTALVCALAEQRYELRRVLDLPVDKYDQLAEMLVEEAQAAQQAIAEEYSRTPLLFWPRAEHAEAGRRWPSVVPEEERTWDDHRAGLESALKAWSESRWEVPPLVSASADGLAGFAAERGADLNEPETFDRYAEQLVEAGKVIEWPPGRNDACWCGSGDKYKKCCRPRSLEILD